MDPLVKMQMGGSLHAKRDFLVIKTFNGNVAIRKSTIKRIERKCSSNYVITTFDGKTFETSNTFDYLIEALEENNLREGYKDF